MPGEKIDLSQPLVPEEIKVTINGQPALPEVKPGEIVFTGDSTELHGGRNDQGNLVIGEKFTDVYSSGVGEPTEGDNRVNWPITQRVPDDPAAATRLSEERRLKDQKD